MIRIDAAQHGTRSRYNVGCRCDGCTAANALYRRVRRNGADIYVHDNSSLTRTSKVLLGEYAWETWDCTPTLAEWRVATGR